MQKWGWAFFSAFCTLVFMLLGATLIEGPPIQSDSADPHPLVVFTGPIASADQKAGDSQAPLRVDVEQKMSLTAGQTMIAPQVRSDANGHPLSGSTYILAVYQAFWLGDRSG